MFSLDHALVFFSFFNAQVGSLFYILDNFFKCYNSLLGNIHSKHLELINFSRLLFQKRLTLSSFQASLVAQMVKNPAAIQGTRV